MVGFVSVGKRIGGGGGPGGPVDAADVTYQNPDYATVEEALNALLYVAPDIFGLTNNRGTVELGSSVADAHLTWSVNKDVTTQTLTSVGSIDPALRAYDLVGPWTTDQTWTVTVGDGTNTDNQSTSVLFHRRRHWGADADTVLSSAEILALANNEFSTALGKAITYDCTGGKYPWYAYPVAFGALSNVTVGGLAFSDYTVDTVSHTNASGHTEDYYTVRFNNIQTGANIQVVWG